MRRKMNSMKSFQVKKISYRLLILWMLLSTYVMLHEAGHALAVLAFGGELTYFSINLFDARIGHHGEFTDFQTAIINVAGAGLPYLTWLVFMIALPCRSKKAFLEYAKTYSVVVLVSLFAWLFIPLLYESGMAPAGDDVTKFLDASGLNGYLISFLILILVLASFLFWKKKNPDAIKIYTLSDAHPYPERRQFIPVLALSALFLILMTFPWINQGAEMGRTGVVLCQSKLDGLEGEYEICKLWIHGEPEEVKFIIEMKNTSADLIHLWLAYPDGVTTTLIRSQGYSVGASRQSLTVELQPGEYRIMMEAENIQGWMVISLD